MLIGRDRYQDCNAQLALARKLDPLSAMVELFSGWNELWVKKDAAAALTDLRRGSELQPDFWWLNTFMAQAEADQGHMDLADQALEKAQASGGSTYVLAVKGYLAAKRGDRAGAQRLLQEVLATQASSGYASPSHPALIYAGLGDTSNAMVWLQRAYDARDEECIVLKVDPMLDGLRKDPAFQSLLAKVEGGR